MNTINPPKVYPQEPLVGTSFTVFIDSMVFNESATFKVVVYDDKNSAILTQYLIMSGQQYLDWGSDDAYVIEWVRIQMDLPDLKLIPPI